MQHRLHLILLIFILTGCATPKLGELYKPEITTSNSPNTTTIYLYMDEKVNGEIYYYAYLDDIEIGKLYKATYLKFPVSVGSHNLRVTEWLSGEGASNALSISKAFSSLLLMENTPVLPSTLQAGKNTTITIDDVSKDTLHVRIEKKAGSELFYQCEATDETITMCTKVIFDSHLQVIPIIQAQQELATFRRSIQ